MTKTTAPEATEAAAPVATPVAAAADNTITLDEPIKRGATTIASITLRKPKSGELRGLSLTELLNMNVTALQALIPRISMPLLNKAEVADMDAGDLTQCGIMVVDFLLPNKAKESVSPTA